MVNKDYQNELRQEILGWYAPCKIRFYPNSVTVTLNRGFSSQALLQESAEDFISQLDGFSDIKLKVIGKSASRFSIEDVGQSVSPTPVEIVPTDLGQLFSDWLEELNEDEDFDEDESELDLGDRPYSMSEAPINSREEILDMLRDLEEKKGPVPSLEERALAVQQEVIEAELSSFVEVNVEHVLELLPQTNLIDQDQVELILTFGFLAGKWSAATMRDLNAIMNVWDKYFGESTSAIGL